MQRSGEGARGWDKFLVTQVGQTQCRAQIDWPLQENGLSRINSNAHRLPDWGLHKTNPEVRTTSAML